MTDRDEIVVVAKLEVEVEVSVPTVKLEVDALLRLAWPNEVKDEVAVISPPVIFENTADSPDNRLEKNPVEEVLLIVVKLLMFPLLLFRLVIVEEEKIGVSVNVYVTSPLVVVAIVRFELVDEARKVYKDATEVEAVTPFMIVVT